MTGSEQPLWHYRGDTVTITKLCVGSWENNTYVVKCRATGAGVVIDAAAEPDIILGATAGIAIEAILTTHGHFDHVGAATAVATELDIPWRLHAADADTFQLDPDEPLVPGTIGVGRATIRAVHTPGHTPGSTCFAVDGVLLSGDTLFPGGPGATRGPGADFATIMDSLDSLFTLPTDTLVLPGHGLDTTIGSEAPHAAAWRARGW
jgi:glyoxylase-like metal-dependent hydrolase (beta-lactamase superfamily II)